MIQITAHSDFHSGQQAVCHSLCRAHSLAPAGAGTAARPGGSFAQLPAGAARAKPRPQPSVAAARPSKTALAGTAASRLSRALRDVPMLDATVKGAAPLSLQRSAAEEKDLKIT